VTAVRPELSIVIVSFDTLPHLRRCLMSIQNHPADVPQEIVVIDNDSSDGSAEMVTREFPVVRLLRSKTNTGYGVAANEAVAATTGRLLLLLNPDIEVSPGALSTLVAFAGAHPRAGVIGPMLLLGDGQPQPSARRFLSSWLLLAEGLRLHLLLPLRLRSKLLLGTYFDQREEMRVPWISGACHLVPRSVWEAVGRLTEDTFCGFDDYDYCYRATRAKYEVWLCPSAVMTHHCSVAVRQRWASWDVEQLAMHNTYVVLSNHWSAWRVRSFMLAELITWIAEGMRHALWPRLGLETLDEPYSRRLGRRIRLDFRLLCGLEKPRRRFQPPTRQAKASVGIAS
jgi:N-acetylglucosaminyl-diphospho-decaprenol L-rhamnosyltransferase